VTASRFGSAGVLTRGADGSDVTDEGDLVPIADLCRADDTPNRYQVEGSQMSTPESSTRSKVAKWIAIAYVVLVIIAMLDGFRSFVGAIFLYGFLAAIAWGVTFLLTRDSGESPAPPRSEPARGQVRAVWGSSGAADREAVEPSIGGDLDPSTSPFTTDAGAPVGTSATDAAREAKRARFDALDAGMRNMMTASSYRGAAKAVSYYKRGVYSLVVGLSSAIEVLDAHDPVSLMSSGAWWREPQGSLMTTPAATPSARPSDNAPDLPNSPRSGSQSGVTSTLRARRLLRPSLPSRSSRFMRCGVTGPR
jgi:hypothetical protein